MNYAEAVDYLMTKLPMFQRVGAAAYRADLQNITSLCAHLGQPHLALRCIHIAGTNGKGSVSHLLASILQAQGYKTGLFTSPHYTNFRERIKVNGEWIHEEYVADFVANKLRNLPDIDPSFFEMTTAMAFSYFRDQKTDIVVVETGMGGRLDSTNIIHPILSVITNISMDHQAFLGSTHAQIALEKAGIIKKGVPVVIGETHPETREVFKKKARECRSDVWFADQFYTTQSVKNKKLYRLIDIYRKRQRMGTYLTDMLGDYQLKNISTASMAVELLKSGGIEISASAFRRGINFVRKHTQFTGRWLIVNLHPLVIIDSAHNEAGIQIALQSLQQYVCRKLHIVYGCVEDKDMTAMWNLLPKDALYYFCKADIPRGMDAVALQQKMMEYGLQGAAYTSVQEAYQAARQFAVKSEIVLVTGSVFIAAEAL